jgi:FMN phosphatase YigB (HAD superfamily)
MRRPRAALVDVGGTLAPDRSVTWASRERAIERLAAVIPTAADDLLERLRSGLREAAVAFSGELVVDADEVVRTVAARAGLSLDPRGVRAVRQALCEPAMGGVPLYEGADVLLRTLRELGLRTVILSNTEWRDAELYRRDFEDLGVLGLLDAIVTSVDVGRRKPHPAMFAAGVEQAGCEAAECLMVGNMEEKDVLPALAAGMRTIRVAIGAAGPVVTAADATARSLAEAAAVVRSWVAAPDERRTGVPQAP